VATDVGAVGELVEPGRSGLLVAPGSPEELADALIAIAAARERWSEMGRAGRAKVEREFTLPASIDALQALFAAAARAPR